MEILRLFFYIVFSILFVSSSYALDENYEYLKISIQNDISFQTDIEEDFSLSNFNLNSYFLPLTYNGSQYLNDFTTTNSDYTIMENGHNSFLRFFYDENTLLEKNNINNKFIVQSIVQYPKISNKVSYPIDSVDDEYLIYLDYSGLIDLNDPIREQASSLAEGEDDVYLIATKIAKWIRNDIDYDLESVLANPNQKSSQVFMSKQGVCKEITNLYVSMMRSLGIPTRVVTGFAYTESEELVDFLDSNWGGHAWAEVLIGDVWVPFDLTYDQYGYVDSTHIITHKGPNVVSDSVSLNSSGYGYNLVDNSLSSESSFKILDKGNVVINQGFDFSVKGPEKLGFGSYGYIKVNVRNLENHYQILFMSLSKAKEVELIGPSKIMHVFLPGETKELYFRYKLSDNLDESYVYTFPFLIYTDDWEYEREVESKKDYMVIDKAELPEEPEDKMVYSENDLKFDCNYVMDVESNLLLCSVRNTNNFNIDNLKVCLMSENNCKSLTLRINEEESFNFKTEYDNITLIYDYKGLEKKGSLSFELSIPSVKIVKSDNTDSLIFSYDVEDYLQGLVLDVYIDGVYRDTKSLSGKNSVIELDSLDSGSYDIRFELVYMDRVLQNEIFKDVLIEKKSLETDKKSSGVVDENGEKGFFEGLISWFMGIFN